MDKKKEKTKDKAKLKVFDLSFLNHQKKNLKTLLKIEGRFRNNREITEKLLFSGKLETYKLTFTIRTSTSGLRLFIISHIFLRWNVYILQMMDYCQFWGPFLSFFKN